MPHGTSRGQAGVGASPEERPGREGQGQRQAEEARGGASGLAARARAGGSDACASVARRGASLPAP
eukprot:1384683-Alexandrium_andersonii.AAC.1